MEQALQRPDLIQTLSLQHERTRDLLKAVSSSADAARGRALEELHRDVQIQFIVEENILYPILREHVGGMQAEIQVAEAQMRHALVDRGFAALYGQDTASTEFGFKLSVVQEALERHMTEQRDEVFPALRSCCSKEKLQELARPVQQKRRALEQARVGAAHSPSW